MTSDNVILFDTTKFPQSVLDLCREKKVLTGVTITIELNKNISNFTD